MIISFLDGYQTELCARDLSSISEYLRKIKDSFGPSEMKLVLRRASAVSISPTTLQSLLDGFFRAEAVRLLGQEEGQPKRPQGSEAAGWSQGETGQALLRQGRDTIADLRRQYQHDVQHYEAKLATLGHRLGW